MKKLLFIALLAFFAGCNPDESENNNNNPDNFAENFGADANRDFFGRVVDMNGNALTGVSVSAGNVTAMTDANGVFMLDDAPVREKFAYLKAEKAGFMQGSRSLVPTSGRNYVKIMMIPSTPVATISSGSEAEVALPSGTKVIFDGSFEDASGNAYSGDVSVSMYHLMPSNDAISQLMPGMLYGSDENGDEAVLTSFGMLNVELRGSGGQKLQLADGHTAEIEMMIDASQLASAPSSMPLWHFDEAGGYWKRDGSATKTGNRYVGEVSHFSWWNCDQYSSVVNLTVSVTDANGQPISNVGVGLIASNGFISYVQTTNTLGQVSGIVPANMSMTMNVFDNCGTQIYTTSIGPFTQDTALPAIQLTDLMTQTTQVQGSLLQCDGQPVSSGYLIFDYGNQSAFYPISNGSFNFSTLVCQSGASFTLQGFDTAALQSTGEISYNFSSPVTQVGNLQACTAVSEFISYQLDGGAVNYILTGITASAESQTSNGLYIYGQSQNGMYVWSSANMPGIYSTNEFSVEGGIIGYLGSQSPNDVVFNLTQIGAVGEYIDLSFSGNYQDSTGTSHTINYIAHVIRDN